MMGVDGPARLLHDGATRRRSHRDRVRVSPPRDVIPVALDELERDVSQRRRPGLRVEDPDVVALEVARLRKRAAAHLRVLRRESACTASLSVLDGSEIVCVDRAHGLRGGRDTADIAGFARGARLPAHGTAMGKVLLANVPERERSELLCTMRLTKHGPSTMTSRTALRVELEAIQQNDFAVEDEELAPGRLAIAVPVRAASGRVLAAVDIETHTATIGLWDFVEELGPWLIYTGERISEELGYRREPEPEREHELHPPTLLL